MAYPKSLRQPFRQGNLSVGNGWRAFFTPFNQALAVTSNNTSQGVTIYDLMAQGAFNEGTQAVGFFDLGWVKNVKITPGSKIGNIASGYRGAIRAKYRGEIGEKFSLDFSEMTRTAYKISTGCQIFNLLKSTATPSTLGPLSSSGVTAVPLAASGYQPTGLVSGPTLGLPTLFVPAGSGALFPAGTMIVCDLDYNGTSFGYIGDAGANVSQFSIPSDVDFIRKTSDYVSNVLTVVPNAITGQDALILNEEIIGGGTNPTGPGSLKVPAVTLGPGSLAKVQAINGYTSREGGTAINEWTCVLSMTTTDNAQFVFYYPRVSPDTYGGLTPVNISGINSLMTFDQPASFDALAFDDPLDGETVTSYRSYFPRGGSGQQISY